MQTIFSTLFRILTAIIICISTVSCTPFRQNLGITAEQRIEEESKDFSCSYFYFLWGTHEEYNQQFSEALDAYEKALVCDSSAEYIREKLPLLYIKMNEPQMAINQLEQVIEKQPDNTEQRALLARILQQQKDNEGAIKQYQKILSYEPKNEQALLGLGILFSQAGDFEQSRASFKKLLELNQEAYFALLYLARIADRLDDSAESEKKYQEAIELNWSPDLAYEFAEFHLKHQQYEKCIQVLRPVLKNNEKDERARFTIVQALLAMEREEEAIAELSLAREISNSPERITLVISRLYLLNGNSLKAEQNLLTIIETTENAEARYLLAVIYLDEKRYDDALRILEKITAQQEEFEDSVVLKSKILHENNRLPEAISMMQGYLADAAIRRPIFYLITSSLYLANKQSPEALDTLKIGMQLFPDDEKLLFEYGLQLERTNKLEEAITVMQKILVSNPDHAEALNFIGYSWADTNKNLPKALEYITRAMELKPENGYIQDSLGWVHFRLGNLEKAKTELIGALTLVPDDPYIYEHLGDVYLSLGMTEDARASYESALQHSDDEKKKDGIRSKIDALDTSK